MNAAAELWQQALDEIKGAVTHGTFDLWLAGSVGVELAEDMLTVRARNGMARDWLEKRLTPVIMRALSAVAKRPITPRFVAAPSPPPLEAAPPPTADLEVHDRRRGFVKVDNEVIDSYLPLMGPTAFAVYALYCRLTHHRTGAAWPSMRTVCAHLHIGPATLMECNTLLEVLGLIEIERGNERTSNRYYVQDAPELTAAVAERIRTAACAWSEGHAVRQRLLASLASAQPPAWASASPEKPSAHEQKPSASPAKPSVAPPETETNQQTHTSMMFSPDQEMLAQLLELGLERRTAMNVLATTPAERLTEWLTYIAQQTNLRNPAGFLLSRLGTGEPASALASSSPRPPSTGNSP